MESGHPISSSTSDEKKIMLKEPLLSNPNPKGGIRSMPFIIANESFERVASFGLTANMIMYLSREYNVGATAGSNMLFFWSAATNFTPILGAFLADSYVGRYRMIGFGSVVSLLGMVLLWFTAIFPQARPPPCDQISGICESPTTSQLLLLYSCFCLMSIGAGGIRSSSLAFGADQLRRGDNQKNACILQSYFSWYYVSVTASSIIAVTCIVYIQDNLGWNIGLVVPAALMFLSALSFFMASPFYVKMKANSNLLTELFQVIVASYKNRHVKLSSLGTDEIYHHRKGSTLLKPSENLRCLNKACIIRNPQQDLTPDGRASNPWSLCTVDQVEELKALVKVIPLWSTGILSSLCYNQHSFPVIQASTMNRHITPNFEIPPGSFGIFMIITLTLWIALYDRIILPLASKIKGKPAYISIKKRLGIGLLLSCASLAAWAIVESIRREIAIKEGFSDNPRGVVNISAMWLLPHHILSGLSMAFNGIAQNEFYYSELPKSMASIASSLGGVGMAMGSLASSFIMNTVDDVTKRGGKESWVSSNMNKGHYDYYFWTLTGLSTANFIYFLGCSKAYGPCKEEVVNVVKDAMAEEH